MKQSRVHSPHKDGIVVGLTGTMGAGKSSAADLFRAEGALVIDADALSRAALQIGGSCYEETIALFGEKILRQDGTLDRKKIAEIIFEDEQLRLRLEAVVHSAVLREMLDLIEKNRGQYRMTVCDVPLLFESGFDRYTDTSVVIIARDDLRIDRVCRRDGCSSEDALRRMDVQMPQEEKVRRADHVIDNSGTMSELQEQVAALYHQLTEL